MFIESENTQASEVEKTYFPSYYTNEIHNSHVALVVGYKKNFFSLDFKLEDFASEKGQIY